MINWNARKERAERILHLTLPEIRDHDHAMDNFYYVDPTNEHTRLWSIAAALYILREIASHDESGEGSRLLPEQSDQENSK